jgi:hypothetical protein
MSIVADAADRTDNITASVLSYGLVPIVRVPNRASLFFALLRNLAGNSKIVRSIVDRTFARHYILPSGSPPNHCSTQYAAADENGVKRK